MSFCVLRANSSAYVKCRIISGAQKRLKPLYSLTCAARSVCHLSVRQRALACTSYDRKQTDFRNCVSVDISSIILFNIRAHTHTHAHTLTQPICLILVIISHFLLELRFVSLLAQSSNVSHLLPFALAFFLLQSPLRPLLTILINSHHSLCHKSRSALLAQQRLESSPVFNISFYALFNSSVSDSLVSGTQIMRVDIHFIYGKRFVRRCVAWRASE